MTNISSVKKNHKIPRSVKIDPELDCILRHNNINFSSLVHKLLEEFLAANKYKLSIPELDEIPKNKVEKSDDELVPEQHTYNDELGF